MSRPGLHWPNATEDQPEARARFAAGRFAAAVVMTVTPASVAAWLGAQAKVVVIRLYEPAGDLAPAADVVNRHSGWLSEAGPRGLFVQVLSEPDREYPGLSPEAFASWWATAANLLRRAYPQLRIGFPGPSIAASDDYLSRVEATGVLALADFIGERGYWQDASDSSAALFGGRWQRSAGLKRPIVLTEFGCSSSSTAKSSKAKQYLDYCASLPRFVVPAGAFIGAGGDPHWDTSGAGGLWIDDAMAAAIGGAEGERVLDASLVGRVLAFGGLIKAAATAAGIPASIVAGLIAVESGGWPSAVSPDNGPGLGHALGLMQCLQGDFAAGEDGLDPATNLRVGTKLLRAKMNAYGGRLTSGLAAYFGAVDAAGNPTEGTDLTGTTGVRYVAEVTAAAASFAELDAAAPASPTSTSGPAGEVDPVFASYAPHTGTWREAAVNLKGIADDALSTGRKIVAEAAAAWGSR